MPEIVSEGEYEGIHFTITRANPGRVSANGDAIGPWGCGRWNGYDTDEMPMQCEWGNLCEDCEKL